MGIEAFEGGNRVALQPVVGHAESAHRCPCEPQGLPAPAVWLRTPPRTQLREPVQTTWRND